MPNDDWPHCPGCEKQRTTRCPICFTNGLDFDLVDPEFLGIPMDETRSPSTDCNCGLNGCADPETKDIEDSSALEGGEVEYPDPPRMLMCSTCDEPFVPDYPNQCEWCDHQFDNGYEVVEPPPSEEISGRIIFVMLALATVLITVMGYFMFILN